MDALLFEDESTTLDFKQEQYPFIKADDEQKSEILKDILAFANAWRRSDAYILIGVEEKKNEKNIVKGITQHIDEASLQQFVNKKTNRPIDFSYSAIEYDGKQIGVIQIPLQERPFFLLKNYGKLHKSTVYIRRGSSTDIANPDEITKMGIAMANGNPVPTLIPQFADVESHIKKGSKLELVSTKLSLPSEAKIPSIQSHYLEPIVNRTNPNYYKEFYDYLFGISVLQPVGFVLFNSGEVLAKNAVMKFLIEKKEGVALVDTSDYPDAPKYSGIFPSIAKFRNMATNNEPNTSIHARNNHWEVVVEFGNIQPKASVWSEYFYIGAAQNYEVPLEVLIYADNLPNPITSSLQLSITVEQQTITVEDVITKADLHQSSET